MLDDSFMVFDDLSGPEIAQNMRSIAIGCVLENYVVAIGKGA
jgi:hypothetical protein